LALIAERGSRAESWMRVERRSLRDGRCCYGHLAGRLGVALYDALVASAALESSPDGFLLTDAGIEWFGRLGMQPAPPTARRRYAYACMDWSERRDHLAGQLADQALQHFLARRWLRRSHGRAIALTPAGGRHLGRYLPELLASDTRS
ncbi:MAG TPA: hypothetical protein VMT92_07480, partial [Steroidobacteraceae bacterium]|nr:hypothetical protein [Steroidobacteraceae bacterium]